MKKIIKSKWLRALRSGKYQKGTGSLKTAKGRFCCLGVLCDLYAKEKGIDWEKTSDWGGEKENRMFGEKGYLPDKVQRWAGLQSENPSVENKKTGDVAELSDWNDNRKYGFKKIAELIKTNL